MKAVIILLIIVMMLLIVGCTRGGYTQQTAYQGQQPSGGYIGGGCSVSSPPQSDLIINPKLEVKF